MTLKPCPRCGRPINRDGNVWLCARCTWDARHGKKKRIQLTGLLERHPWLYILTDALTWGVLCAGIVSCLFTLLAYHIIGVRI